MEHLTTQSYRRDPIIDAARGIAIILVVGGHSWLPQWCNAEFVSLFHMSLFMTISGYCFRERHMESLQAVGKYIRHRLWTLYLPYAVSNAIFILLNNVFLNLHIYCGSNELADIIRVGVGMDPYLSGPEMFRQVLLCFLFIGYSPRMGGGTWFLRALFCISILYAIIGYFLLRIKKFYNCVSDNKAGESSGFQIMDTQMIIALFFLIIWAADQRYHLIRIGSISQIFQYYFAYALGDFCRRHRLMNHRIAVQGIAAAVSCCLLQLIERITAGRWYTDAILQTGAMSSLPAICSVLIFFLIQAVTGILGWCMVYGVSAPVCRFIPFLEKILVWCGQGTLETLLLHFLCFKLVTELYILIHHLPQFYLGATPILPDIHAGWGCLYILAGVGIPTAVHFIRVKMRNCARMGLA